MRVPTVKQKGITAEDVLLPSVSTIARPIPATVSKPIPRFFFLILILFAGSTCAFGCYYKCEYIMHFVFQFGRLYW